MGHPQVFCKGNKMAFSVVKFFLGWFSPRATNRAVFYVQQLKLYATFFFKNLDRFRGPQALMVYFQVYSSIGIIVAIFVDGKKLVFDTLH